MRNLSQEMELNERLDLIEFRQDLLFNNSEVDRILFENGVTRTQYTKIMTIMEKLREDLYNKTTIKHGEFEQQIYDAIPHLHGNYHFCEHISRAFMNDGRWEEVFPALYGDMTKYKGI